MADLRQQKEITAELEKQKKILEGHNKTAKSYKDALKEINRLNTEQWKIEKKISEEKDRASLEAKTLNIEKQILKLQQTGLGALQKELGLDKQIQILKKGQSKNDKETVRQTKAYGDLLQGVAEGSMDLEAVLNLIATEDFGIMNESAEQLAETLRNTPDLTKKLKIEAQAQQKINDFRDKISETSALLSSPKAMGVAAIGMAVKLMKDFVDKALELRQSLGTSAVESARLAGNMTAAGFAAKAVGGSSQEAEAAVTGLVQEFGSLSVVSAGVSAKLGLMTGQFGISGANAAKLLKSMEAINGASIETNLNLISSVGELARAEGVAPAQVLNDIAESTETFAQFAKDGGQNIAKAAIEARKLGLNLSTVAGIAESLLDFESSIEKEMEASMLLGRQMNLDKARELALTGDLEGLAKEVKNQVGSQAEFEAMNVVQRKALADAMGVTVADMGKMVAGEKTSAQIAEEQVATQKKQMDMQMIMMGVMTASQGVQLAMVASQGISALLSRQKAKSDLTSAAANVAGAAGEAGKSAAKVPVIGAVLALAAIAAVGAAGYKLLNKKPPGLLTGGVVKETGMAEVHRGEVFSGTKNEAGFGTDMTETNNYLKQSLAESKKLREQNEFLMNRLTGRVDGLALSN